MTKKIPKVGQRIIVKTSEEYCNAPLVVTSIGWATEEGQFFGKDKYGTEWEVTNFDEWWYPKGADI